MKNKDTTQKRGVGRPVESNPRVGKQLSLKRDQWALIDQRAEQLNTTRSKLLWSAFKQSLGDEQHDHA